jgi:hypothetical protein
VPSGGYFLVQMSTTGAGAALAPDFTASPTISMAAGAGKIALSPSTTALAGACPLGSTLDFVGYGTTATCSEGAVTANLSVTLAAIRGSGGCTDTNANITDFAVVLPDPRNTGTAADVCSCPANETDKVAELDFCNIQFPGVTSQQVGLTTATIFGQVFEAGFTETAGANAAITMQLGYDASGADPRTSATFTWAPMSYNVQSVNNDEYKGEFTAPGPAGTYSYDTRATRDGTNWTYCDLDGAGSNAGLTFDPTMLGVLTTTP